MYKSKQFQTIKFFLFVLSENESFIVAVQKPPPTRAPHTRMDAERTSLIKMSHEATNTAMLLVPASLGIDKG